jgi:GTP pyrophosphokinase
MQGEKVIVSNQIVREYRKLLKFARASVHTIDTSAIRKAFTIANSACLRTNHNFREPLLMQSLHIAQIVTSEKGLSTSAIIATLLYKFVENKSLELEELNGKFEESLIVIAEELAKISAVNTTNISSQPENFRKLLLTLTSDVTVILIKLAERLYFMRNLDMEDSEVQVKIAREVFDLYAPIGHRLGLYSLKTELEDLSMKYSNPNMYNFISLQLQETASKRNKFIKEIIAPIKAELDEQGFDYEIKSRTKSIYSIWNKMRKKNVEFEEVYDLFAIRIILNSEGNYRESPPTI